MLARLRTYASFVRFSHSLFALPFALVGALLAARVAGWEWRRVLWIALCMVTARSAAMGFNRIVDARFDARNPRTAQRELPTGRMSATEARIFVAVSGVAFVLCAAQLGTTCLLLSPVALAIVFWYSLAKRYTSYTQAFLGLAMAVAPVGGWIAAGGPVAVEPVLLGVAIGAWVAGFDILYACQDIDVDRREGLHSIPVRFGVPASLWISRALHVVTIAVLAVVGGLASLGGIYTGGVVAVAGLLIYEQSLVRPDDLSQVKRAFDLNGWVGVLYLATTAAAIYWK
ncbi:MAG TPA: 4-hydroxybenzoate octaprenyltransferase [Vicinamibacterales bacterium]|nr:4-hydroxybenzoate octaprenyltransferase [Vicinamibacterales bacterium]